jgi:hypothetical protein
MIWEAQKKNTSTNCEPGDTSSHNVTYRKALRCCACPSLFCTERRSQRCSLSTHSPNQIITRETCMKPRERTFSFSLLAFFALFSFSSCSCLASLHR